MERKNTTKEKKGKGERKGKGGGEVEFNKGRRRGSKEKKSHSLTKKN